MGPKKQASVNRIRPRLASFFYPLNQDLYRLLEQLGYTNFPKFKSDLLVEESGEEIPWGDIETDTSTEEYSVSQSFDGGDGGYGGGDGGGEMGGWFSSFGGVDGGVVDSGYDD